MRRFRFICMCSMATGRCSRRIRTPADPHGSDSDGKGVWVPEGGEIKGKWVEVIADRTTHKYAGRLEISFRIRVNGDTFVGTESVRAFDAAGNVAEAPPTPGQLEGKRVTIP